MAYSSPALPASEGPGVPWPPPIPGLLPLPTAEPRLGGFGEIYPIIQESLQRVVCLKILGRRHLREAEQAISRSSAAFDAACANLGEQQRWFMAEIDITASLRSRYVPAVHDHGEVSVPDSDAQDAPWSDDWPYFVMEWIEGPTLMQSLSAAKGPWPADKVGVTHAPGRFDHLTAAWQTRLLDLFTEIALALRDAHQQGVAHLDVTPRNILLKDDSDIKLIDWGLARRVDKDHGGSGEESGRRAGSPDYMAPEQVLEQEQTPQQIRPGVRADVYALGGIGYLLLTGKPPRASTAADRGKAVREMRDQALCPGHHEALYQRLNACGAPLFWVNLVERCLSQNPGGRYADAGEVVRAIENYRTDQDRREREAEKHAVRSRWVAITAVLLGLTVLGVTSGLVASLLLWRRAVAGEAQALANLQAKEDALGETEEHCAMLYRLIGDNMLVSTQLPIPYNDPVTPLNPALEKQYSDIEQCCTRLLQKRGDDPILQALLAKALTYLGSFHVSRAQLAEALDYYERARNLLEQTPPEFASSPDHLFERANLCSFIGRIQAQRQRPKQSMAAFETCFKLMQELANRNLNPGHEDSLIFAGFELGQARIKSGYSAEESLDPLKDSLTRIVRPGSRQECEQWLDILLVQYLAAKADRHFRVRETAAGLALTRDAAAVLSRHIRQPFGSKPSRFYAAYWSLEIGSKLLKTREPGEALCLFEGAIRMFVALNREAPEEEYCGYLSQSWVEIGKARLNLHQTEEALAAFSEAERVFEQVASRHPDNLRYGASWVECLANIGNGLHEAAQDAAALAKLREAVATATRYASVPARDRLARSQLARNLVNLSGLLRQVGERVESLQQAELARQLYEELRREAPDQFRWGSELSDAWVWVGKAQWALGQTEEAMRSCRTALDIQRQVVAQAPTEPVARRVLDARYGQLGRKLCVLGRLDEAEDCFRDRLALWPGDFEKHEEVLRELRKWAKEVGDGKKDLSPEKQREQQRYLDLCDRLERKGSSVAVMAGGEKP